MKKKNLLLTALATLAIGLSILIPAANNIGSRAGGGGVVPECTAGHHSGNHYLAKAPTCEEPGNKEFWACCTCLHQYLENPGGTFVDRGVYDGPALASTHIAYIAPTGHNLVHHPAAPGADCLHLGTIEYWECSTCGKKFSDALATTEITSVEAYGDHTLTLEPHDHTIDTYHCSVCNKDFTADGKEIDLTNRIPNNATFEPTVKSVEIPSGTNVRIPGAESYINWSPTPSHIVLEEDGNVAFRVDQLVWGQYSHFMKDISFDCLAAGTYEFKFDIKVSETAKTAVAGGGDPSKVYYRVKLGASNIYEFGPVLANSLSTTEYTTITGEFTNAAAISTDWAQVEINYWAEGSIDNNFILLDNFRIIEKGDATNTNIDRRENTYYDCNEDRFLIETLVKNSGVWKHRFVNFDNTDTYIVTGKGDNRGVIQQQGWGVSSVMLFDIGANFYSAGEYTFSFDARPSYNASVATNPSGFTSFIEPQIGTPSGWQSLGQKRMGELNPNEFTKVSIDFTATHPNPTGWVQASFWYWAEGTLDTNFIEIDNIQITRKGETTPLGNDREYNGGFEFFTYGPDFTKPGFYEGGFGAEPGTEARIIRETGGNHALKLAGDVNDVAFNFGVGEGVLQANKSYMLTMRVKLGEGCLNLGAVAMTTFAQNGRYLNTGGSPLVVEVVGADNTLTPADGWVIVHAEFKTGDFAAVGWCDLYFFATISNATTKDATNYLLVDDVNIFTLNV